MATVAAKLVSSAAGVALSLPTISAVDADSMMGEGELHGLRLPGDSVRLEIYDVPTARDCRRGSLDEHSLAHLISRTSRRAFEHVRSSLHRLDMARELIASGCPELQLTAPALLEFSVLACHLAWTF